MADGLPDATMLQETLGRSGRALSYSKSAYPATIGKSLSAPHAQVEQTDHLHKPQPPGGRIAFGSGQAGKGADLRLDCCQCSHDFLFVPLLDSARISIQQELYREQEDCEPAAKGEVSAAGRLVHHKIGVGEGAKAQCQKHKRADEAGHRRTLGFGSAVSAPREKFYDQQNQAIARRHRQERPGEVVPHQDEPDHEPTEQDKNRHGGQEACAASGPRALGLVVCHRLLVGLRTRSRADFPNPRALPSLRRDHPEESHG
jgi:hypothetical protein